MAMTAKNNVTNFPAPIEKVKKPRATRKPAKTQETAKAERTGHLFKGGTNDR
jgi:hypothetical protein